MQNWLNWALVFFVAAAVSGFWAFFDFKPPTSGTTVFRVLFSLFLTAFLVSCVFGVKAKHVEEREEWR